MKHWINILKVTFTSHYFTDNVSMSYFYNYATVAYQPRYISTSSKPMADVMVQLKYVLFIHCLRQELTYICQ